MDPDKALEHVLETARFILGGTAGDMFEESAEELAQQILDLDQWLRRGGFPPKPWNRKAEKNRRTAELEKAVRNLLQDIGEVLERQGEEWWDETVTSGTHHRDEAAKLVGGEGTS